MSREVVIVAYGRSAVCKSRKGSFAGTHPIEYSAQVLKGVLDKVPQLDRSEIEDVIMGCAVQHGTTSMNIAKSVCARAELPECVAGHTINRFCSSGLQAIATGAFLTCKALDYLQDNKKTTALVTMCIGGGMGAAAVFELL